MGYIYQKRHIRLLPSINIEIVALIRVYQTPAKVSNTQDKQKQQEQVNPKFYSGRGLPLVSGAMATPMNPMI